MDVEMRQAVPDSKSSHVNHGMVGRSGGNRDEMTLARIGKKQVLKRNFGFLSMMSFSCTVLVTWEGVLVLFATGFLNGGTAGLVWQFILVWGGTLSTFVTIGELASMAPTAGGQYHWVNMLAPKSFRNFLSYITGWMTVLAWVATIATGAYLSATMIQALCLINWPDYANVFAGWQGTLISWAVVLVCVFFNTVVGSLLPKVEGSFMLLHVLGFFAILIPLVYCAPKATAAEVFGSTTGYQNQGMWPTYGVSFMVGTLGAAFSFVGADAAVHMSEEISNAAVNVPRSIVASIMINGSLGFGMLLAIIFCLGDPQAALEAQETIGYPFIEVFMAATQSLGGATGMTSIVIALAFSCTIGFMATASRIIWSFARDRGLPFSRVLCHLSPHSTIPTYAVIVAATIPCLLVLINIGSSVVFNDVTSLALVGFYSTYFICCALLLYRRLATTIHMPDPSAPAAAYKDEDTDEYVLVWGPWHVRGALGVANNILACCYLILIWIFGFFPPAIPVTAASMNYSSLVFGATAFTGEKQRDDGNCDRVAEEAFKEIREQEREITLKSSRRCFVGDRVITRREGRPGVKYWVGAAHLRHRVEFLLVLKGVKPCVLSVKFAEENDPLFSTVVIDCMCLVPIMDRLDLRAYGFRVSFHTGSWVFYDARSPKLSPINSAFLTHHNDPVPDAVVADALGYPFHFYNWQSGRFVIIRDATELKVLVSRGWPQAVSCCVQRMSFTCQEGDEDVWARVFGLYHRYEEAARSMGTQLVLFIGDYLEIQSHGGPMLDQVMENLEELNLDGSVLKELVKGLDMKDIDFDELMDIYTGGGIGF
ncbi:hypothetical protein diail_8474 [Diaporthe ilicicola]|nr:hypothetical protein diail_8474 [Diaporthe ilicicola]